MQQEIGVSRAGDVLPAMTDHELIALVRSRPAGDPQRERAYELLVARYQPVVRACVAHYRLLPDLGDELMQVGYLGLVKAISRFDPQLSDNLGAYARPCINGEIKRYFRDKRWQVRVDRPAQELRLAMREITAELTQKLGHEPGQSELAAALYVTEDEVRRAQLAEQVFQSPSLDAPTHYDDGSATLGELVGSEDPQLEHIVDMQAVHTHWHELDDQIQQMLILRFYGNMTQSEIGDRLGVSQMHVSRLLSRGLAHLRRRLTETTPPSARPETA